MQKTTKATKATKAKTEKKATVERVNIKWRPVLDILSDAVEGDNRVTFDLVERQNGLPVVTLTIYQSESSVDPCVLDVMGISIRGMVCDSKNGLFIALPSHKSKDGQYYNDVTIYDKNWHNLTSELLAAYYGGDNA